MVRRVNTPTTTAATVSNIHTHPGNPPPLSPLSDCGVGVASLTGATLGTELTELVGAGA